MIDLTNKSLPNTVNVDGRDFSIYTDFRLWMRFENSIANIENGRVDISYLFKNDMPISCDRSSLFAFSRPYSELPRDVGRSLAQTYSFSLDGDYIYSAFLGQYGIDLIDIEELHWHKFLAMFRGLNDSTMMAHIMSYRGYIKETRKDFDRYEELRQMWEIEPQMSQEEKDSLDEFNRAFGGDA